MAECFEKTDEASGEAVTPTSIARVASLRAVTQLLAPVSGRSVLDLACGDGCLARWLAVHGAHVTAADTSVQAVEAARAREIVEPHGISYLVGDPDDLYMVDDSTFDDVVCNLSLARMEHLASVVAEVARIIRLGGRFVFAVTHPCFDLKLLAENASCPMSRDYFDEGERDGLNGPIYHRTVATYINAVAARGFTVRRVLEPSADENDLPADSDMMHWSRVPIVLAVEAVFPRI